MALLGLIALGFSLYAGYAKLAWWLPAVVGCTIAAVVALMRVGESAWRDKVAAGDPKATTAAFNAAIVSGVGGAAFHTVVYYIVRLIVG